MDASRDAQIAHMQAQLMAAQATQSAMQARILELESLLSIQQQQQVALSALGGLGPQELALAASGLLPGFPNLRPPVNPPMAPAVPAQPSSAPPAMPLNWAMLGAMPTAVPMQSFGGAAPAEHDGRHQLLVALLLEHLERVEVRGGERLVGLRAV